VALALDLGAVLVTDDHTMLDVAARLGIATQTIGTAGITATMDWRLRCAGCGRWYDEAPPHDECIVCGHSVRPRPKQTRQP
jgi:endoribonuclease Nob1